MPSPDIPAYLDFLPASLLDELYEHAEPVERLPDLRVAPGLMQAYPDVETPECLALVVRVYMALRTPLARLLAQRKIDRAFLDAEVQSCVSRNADRPYDAADYATPIGSRDDAGRLVLGPLPQSPGQAKCKVPDFVRGDQVTLFGPPDTARMAIHAMNAIHRKRGDEPGIVAQLLADETAVPRWGADNEDSKTPIMRNYLSACRNLKGCYDGSLEVESPKSKEPYRISETQPSIPIKRIPGLALPDGNHIFRKNPLPLHLYDLVQHVWHNRHQPNALLFYVPKLENEEEAAYLRELIEHTEREILIMDPSFVPGQIRVLVVFENPRAIFRIREIAAALGDYFLGGSLGWHDFLASTARLFRHDPRYRIPVKADPDIVIRHIKESHDILADQLGPLGALKLGGMYGVLFEEGNDESFQVSMLGFIRDVIAQLKRKLDGFWVAHPDFVRIGLALVLAYRRRQNDPADTALHELVEGYIRDPDERRDLWAFIEGPDVPGLSAGDPRYLRGVLAADLETSPVIANDDPEEIRYNIFQALQYLADWLCGNGCVALPASLRDRHGKSIFVRIMDDLATTERSRWELWAEVQHGRVSQAEFERILKEEIDFLQANEDTETRRIQVRWENEAARWYPIAVQVLHHLVTTPTPPEFVPELILPFTFDEIRTAKDPWTEAKRLCPDKYKDWRVDPPPNLS